MKALVVGGGIGGLTAALALHRAGVEVELYEQTQQLTTVGAGLQVSPNAARVLVRLGLQDSLERWGTKSEQFSYLDLHSDFPLFEWPMGSPAVERYGTPVYQLHRADLLAMLHDALPAEVLNLESRVSGYKQDDDSVTLTLESGLTVTGDVLIGADGIHSVIRDQMLGVQQLDFAHIVAWRALIPAERLKGVDLPRECLIWLAPNRSITSYWVHGGEYFNFIGMVPSEETEESWIAHGDVERLRASFHGSNPRVQAIVNEIEAPFITGYYFRYPLPRWTEGRVTLLGDSAHPMHPFVAQGACQAIEDAGVLARLLGRADASSAAEALLDYERRRRPRASRVQEMSRRHEKMWHLADPRAIVQRNNAFRSIRDIDRPAVALIGWLYAYDPEAAADAPGTDPALVMRRPEAQEVWRALSSMTTPEDLDRGIPGLREAYDRFLTSNDPALESVTISRDAGGPVPVLTATADADGPVLLHLHGGGYLIGSATASAGLASRLAHAVGGSCVVPDFRLAPEHPYPAALEDAVAACQWLIASGVDPHRLVLTGESAGGALAVAVAVRLRELGEQLPAAVVAMSPFADLGLGSASIWSREGKDPIATPEMLLTMASQYLQGSDPRSPYASPVYADLTGLPPTLVQAASNEALFDDAERLVAMLRSGGTAAEFERYEDSFHVFQNIAGLPETAQALSSIASFVQSHTRPAVTAPTPSTK